ncbi:hypothetical protein F4861DRAFT_334432 [Xylaria intraflava]|nr:hypothetical protein F4861DRAFT_334432 [Xylaria intraflava]
MLGSWYTGPRGTCLLQHRDSGARTKNLRRKRLSRQNVASPSACRAGKNDIRTGDDEGSTFRPHICRNPPLHHQPLSMAVAISVRRRVPLVWSLLILSINTSAANQSNSAVCALVALYRGLGLSTLPPTGSGVVCLSFNDVYTIYFGRNTEYRISRPLDDMGNSHSMAPKSKK